MAFGISKRILFRNFLARIRHLLRFNEILKWEYEICNRCGIDYRLDIIIKNDKWIDVNGREGGCLCADCFIKIAQEKNIDLSADDFLNVWVFNPAGQSFDIKGEI